MPSSKLRICRVDETIYEVHIHVSFALLCQEDVSRNALVAHPTAVMF